MKNFEQKFALIGTLILVTLIGISTYIDDHYNSQAYYKANGYPNLDFFQAEIVENKFTNVRQIRFGDMEEVDRGGITRWEDNNGDGHWDRLIVSSNAVPVNVEGYARYCVYDIKYDEFTLNKEDSKKCAELSKEVIYKLYENRDTAMVNRIRSWYPLWFVHRLFDDDV